MRRLGSRGLWALAMEREAAARRERGGISLRLFFLDLNDYIASLFIVLSRLVS